MKKLITIEGMMCNGCSSSVKAALEALKEIKSAAVSHETGEAVIEFVDGLEVSNQVLEDAIEDLDFVVIDIKTLA